MNLKILTSTAALLSVSFATHQVLPESATSNKSFVQKVSSLTVWDGVRLTGSTIGVVAGSVILDLTFNQGKVWTFVEKNFGKAIAQLGWKIPSTIIGASILFAGLKGIRNTFEDKK